MNQGKSDYKRYKKSWEHGVLREAWVTDIGAKEDISKNIPYALDLPYHDQLKKNTVRYNKIKITKYFKHLDGKWCKIDINT